MNIFQMPFFIWGFGLVIGIPLLIIVLNEIIDRLRRRESGYAEVFAMMRDVVLPLMATLIVLRFVFAVEEEHLPTRIISTIFWSLLILIIFRITRNIVGTGEYDEDDWRTYIPHMFLRLPPYTIMGYVVFHVIQDVWALPVREMATTLGIGSIVVAFALQDTLSNLVSGLLLVANSPFKTGEWIKVGDAEGKVIAVNWRYTSIETWNSDLIVIPNGAISQESIENFSRPLGRTVVAQDFDIDFSHPPNMVKQVLIQAMRETPKVLQDPPPGAFVVKIDDPTMRYTVEYFVDDYGEKPDIHDDFMTRAWYALQRHKISLPSPTYKLHTYDGSQAKAALDISAETRTGFLERLSNFSILPPDVLSLLGEAASYMRYAATEKVLEIDAVEEGLYVLLSGNVKLSILDDDDVEQTIEHLRSGDFFGETGLFSRAISPVCALVEEDSEILIIPHEAMNDVINRNPSFATEVNALINQRRLAEKRVVQVHHHPEDGGAIGHIQKMSVNGKGT